MSTNITAVPGRISFLLGRKQPAPINSRPFRHITISQAVSLVTSRAHVASLSRCRITNVNHTEFDHRPEHGRFLLVSFIKVARRAQPTAWPKHIKKSFESLPSS